MGRKCSFYQYQKRRFINNNNLNDYLETLHLAPTKFCDLPDFYCKTEFLRSHPLSLINNCKLLFEEYIFCFRTLSVVDSVIECRKACVAPIDLKEVRIKEF